MEKLCISQCNSFSWVPPPSLSPGCHHHWNSPPAAALCSRALFGLHQHPASVSEYRWVHFFPHGGMQWHTFASSALPRQTPFSQTVPLLPSVTRQQNRMEYWWEGSAPTATPPTSTSDITGQQNKIGGITFGAAILLHCCEVCRVVQQTNLLEMENFLKEEANHQETKPFCSVDKTSQVIYHSVKNARALGLFHLALFVFIKSWGFHRWGENHPCFVPTGDNFWIPFLIGNLNQANNFYTHHSVSASARVGLLVKSCLPTAQEMFLSCLFLKCSVPPTETGRRSSSMTVQKVNYSKTKIKNNLKRIYKTCTSLFRWQLHLKT